jgi:hypothetical protein
MLCMIVTCANGRLLWTRIPRGMRQTVWVCQRDNFHLMSPETPNDAQVFVTQLVQHCVALAGAVQTVNQVTL